MNTQTIDHGDAPVASSAESPPPVSVAARGMRSLVIGMLLTIVLVPPLAGFYSYFSGIPLHLLVSNKEKQDKLVTAAIAAEEHVSLVPGEPYAIKVPEEVCAALGIRKGTGFAVTAAIAPTSMRPLELPGSTAFNPSRLARIRARFAPARVVELPQVHDFSSKTGVTEFRDLRQGDLIRKGDLLGVFYSVDVGSKKNDLLDALVQLELDQKIFDRVEKHRQDVPEVFYLTQLKAVQQDRNAINRALNNLKVWDIPQEEIDALHSEAHKIASDKDGWSKTPEGRWVKGEKLATTDQSGSGVEHENPWGRVTLRAPSAMITAGILAAAWPSPCPWGGSR